MQRVYQQNLPLSVNMVMAGFTSTNYREHYKFQRSPDASTSAPQEFLEQIYIWEKCREYLEFAKANPTATLDDGLGICGASLGFAKMTMYSIECCVEDAPFQMLECPGYWLWRYQPFNTPAYLQWAKERRDLVRAASETAVDVEQIAASPVRRAFVEVKEHIAELKATQQQFQRAVAGGFPQLGVPQGSQLAAQMASAIQYEMVVERPPPTGLLAAASRSADDPGARRPTGVEIFEDGSGSDPTAPRPPMADQQPFRAVLRPVPVNGNQKQPLAELKTTGVNSITTIWEEFMRGLNGSLPIREAIRVDPIHWISIGRDATVDKKKIHSQSQLQSRRKFVWEEVLRLAADGQPDADAFKLTSTPNDTRCDAKAKELQARFEDSKYWFQGTGKARPTLAKFMEILKTESEERDGPRKSRKRKANTQEADVDVKEASAVESAH